MKRIDLLWIVFMISVSTINAQLVHNFAYGFGGTGQEDAQSIVTDSQENTYVGGYFSGTVDFYPGSPSFTLQSQGAEDAYVAVYDKFGAFVNAISFSNNLNCKIFGMAVDSQDNLFITGAFTGAVDFDPGAGVTQLTAGGYYDIFVVKLNSSQVLQWAYRIGHTSYDDYGYGITCDKNDNILLTGYFQGTNVDFDPASVTQYLMTSQSGKDVFVLKLDNAGAFQWALDLGGPGSQIHDIGQAIKTDANNDVIVGGSFSGTIDFVSGIGTYNVLSAGSTDGFVAKYSSAGSFIWAKGISSNGIDACYGLCVDSNDNIYSAGSFMSTVIFDQSVPSSSLVTMGGEDAFVTKYNSSGTYSWARGWGTGGGVSDFSKAVCINGSTVTVGGYFNSLVDFDPGPGTNTIMTQGGIDPFISQFDLSGNYLGTYTFGGPNHDYLFAVSTNTMNEVFACGSFMFTVDFDAGPSSNLFTSYGSSDAYLLKLNSSAVGITEIEVDNNLASVYPNPATSIIKIKSNSIMNDIEISDATGKVVLKKKFNSVYGDVDISSLNEGIYIVRVISNQKTQYSKLIKQ